MWITSICDSGKPDELGERTGPSPLTSGIAPLERFVASPELDGSVGTHRCNERSRIDAAHDQAAISLWVQSSNNETTATSRRAAMDKLLNWACMERGKAVSSLDEDDFSAFANFIARPEPLHRWVGTLHPRDSEEWRPFTRCLSGSSRVAVLRHTSSLVGWLSLQRYADLRFCFGKTAMDDGFATVVFTGETAAVDSIEPISVAEWHWIRRTLNLHFPADDLAPQRLITEMLYYGNMKVEEVAKLEKRDFAPPNRVVPAWAIFVNNRPSWRGGQTVYSPPPLSDTVGRWMKQQEVPLDGFVTFRIRDSVQTLLELDAERTGVHARQVLRLAASLALNSGDVGTGIRLRRRSVVNLRGAFASHQHKPCTSNAEAALTRRSLEFGQDTTRRLVSLWDWSSAEHLWTESPRV